MTTEEFSVEFDVLYDNINSNQAPGLNEYEKSIFLTKAQYELIKNYFNPKGNKYQEGFDDNPKRQIDFSMLMKTSICDKVSAAINLHGGSNIGYFAIPSDILVFVNEFIDVTRNNTPTRLVIIPLTFDEYTKLMSKPYRRPNKRQAWRLISSGEGMEYTYTDYGVIANLLDKSGLLSSLNFEQIYSIINGTNLSVDSSNRLMLGNQFLSADGTLKDSSTEGITLSSSTLVTIKENINKELPATESVVQLIPGSADTINNYIIRYVRRPKPIILTDLFDDGLSIDGRDVKTNCELDPSIHQEILQRAVELAKAAYIGDVNSSIELGKRSE